MKKTTGITDEMCRNRFVLFYTLNWFWKEYGHPIGDLHGTVGNKTLYDNILAMKKISLDKHLDNLSKTTGISKEYLNGKTRLNIKGILELKWDRYMKLRAEKRKNGTEKSIELIRLEDEIQNSLRKIKEEGYVNQSEVFSKLIYFSIYGKKKDDTIESRLLEIEQKIQKLGRHELKRAEKEAFRQHYEEIKKYLNRLSAIMILDEWDQER